MSELLKKHEQSCEAAETLITQGKFAAAIHCAYYSCIQLIKHIFLYEVPTVTPAQLDTAMNAQGGGGTHNYLRQQMKRRLLQRGVDRREVDDFVNNLVDLKEKRKEADYDDVKISLTESREARRVSEEINTLIKDTFAIT